MRMARYPTPNSAAGIFWSAVLGCALVVQAHAGADTDALEAARGFTNLLARGTVTERIASVDALARLAREGWDPPSFTVALDALLRTVGDADTNVLVRARRVWFEFNPVSPPQAPPLRLELLPSWTSNLLTECALRGLNSTQSSVRCAAGRALLSRDAPQLPAVSVLLACLDDPVPATRRDALGALAAAAVRDTALATNLEAVMRGQLDSAAPLTQLRGVEGLWKLGVTLKATELCIDAAEKLAALLTSVDTTIQGCAVRWIMRSMDGRVVMTESLREALIETIERGEPEAALCAGWAAQRLLPAELIPELSPKQRAAFNRGMRSASPSVRRGTLDGLHAEADTTWWTVNKEVPEPESTSGPTSILTSKPVTSRRIARSTAQPEILSGLTNALADPDLGVRLRAARAVMLLEDLRQESAPAIRRILADGLDAKESDIQVAVGLFSHQTLAEDFPRLLAKFKALALSSENESKRLAYESLWSVPATGSPDFWEPLCRSGDPAIRALGARLLAAQATAQNWSTNTVRWSSIPKLVDVLVRDPFPPVSSAGLEALRVLTFATNQTPVRAQAVERLTRLATDPNRFVRARLAQNLALGGLGAPPSPTERSLLVTLARDSDPVVRRLAACSLRQDTEGLPAELRNDPDPDVQRIALLPAPRRPGPAFNAGPLAGRQDLASLTQGLKSSAPNVRRKAALELVNEVVATRKPGLHQEVFEALLESYGGDSEADLRRLNLAFTQLAFGPQRATRAHRVCLMCVAEIPKTDGLKRRGLWGLLADTCRSYGQVRLRELSEADAEAIAPLVFENIRSPDSFIRIPAVQCLLPLSAALEGSTKPEARSLGAQARTALVRALKDDQPGVVVAAAAGLTDGSAGDNPNPRLTLPEEPLRDEAMRSLAEQLEASVSAVRTPAAASLALLASWQPDPELAQRAIRVMGSDWGDSGRPVGGSAALASATLSLLPPADPGSVLVRIALEAPEPRCRQCAFEVLLTILDRPRGLRDGRLSALLNELQQRAPRVGTAPNDARPLVQRLLDLSSGPEPTVASASATLRALVEGNPVAWEAVTDWIQSRSKAPEAKQRQEAMDRLADLLQTAPLAGRGERAVGLATPLLDDSDANVRASAAKSVATAQRNSVSPMATGGEAQQALAKRLLDLSVGDDPAATDARASLGGLMTGNESVRRAVSEWLATRTRSADPNARLAAVDWLGNVLNRVSNDTLCGIARRVAVNLGEDPDPGVRIAVFRLLNRAFQSNPPVTAEENRMLASALKSDNPQVRHAAATAVSAGFNHGLAREVVQGAARAIVHAIPQLETHSAARQKLHLLLAQAADNELSRNAVAAIRERLVQLDNDADRAAWLETVGELELARNDPNAAVTAFQQALRLAPGHGTARAGLDKALWAAGRGNEALTADTAPRLNVFEVEQRVRSLAQAGDAQKILQLVNQALDGLKPTYGSLRFSRGFGEPDMIIGRVFPILAAMNQPALVEQFFSDALKRYPNSPTALQELAKWRVQQGRPAEALALYEQELLSNPWDSMALRAFKELCLKGGQIERFETLANKLIQIGPAEPGVNGALTHYYIEQGKTNEARQLVAKYQQAIEHPGHPQPGESGDPDPTWRQATLAGMLAAIGDYNGALAIQEKVSKSESGQSYFDKQTVLEWVRRAGRTNEYDAALKADPAVRLSELQSRVREQIGSGQVDAAMGTAREVLALNLSGEQKSNAWNELAGAFFWDRADKAAVLFGEVVKAHPDDTDALGILANAAMARQDFTQAIVWAEQANRVTPGLPTIVSTLAMAYFQGGRFSDTIALLEKTGDTEMQSDRALLLAQAYTARGDTNGLSQLAQELERRLTADSPYGTLARRDLAWVRQMQGQTEEAIRLMLQVLRDTSVRGAGDPQTLARWYRQLNRLDDAIALCAQRSPDGASEPWRLQELCRLYLLKGMTNEAADALDRFHAAALDQIRAGTADAQVYNHVAWAYVQNRVRQPQALEYATKAAKLAPADENIRDTLAWASALNGDCGAALAAFAAVVTNVAEANPGVSGLSNSAWKAMTELAEDPGTGSVFPDRLTAWRRLLQSNPVAQARLDLVLSLYWAAHGDKPKAAELRTASGYPDERRWLMLGPFPNEADRGFDQPIIPETQAEIDRDAQYPAPPRTLHWEPRFDGMDSGLVGLDTVFNKTAWATGYAWTTIESPSEQPVELHVGSTDNIRVWLNGKPVYEHLGTRSLVLDADRVTVTLRSGRNTLLVKLTNRRGEWRYSVRIAGVGGQPLRGVRL